MSLLVENAGLVTWTGYA